jgi:hypothetical protein
MIGTGVDQQQQTTRSSTASPTRRKTRKSAGRSRTTQRSSTGSPTTTMPANTNRSGVGARFGALERALAGMTQAGISRAEITSYINAVL